MPTIPADVALLTDRRYTASHAAANDWYLQNILDDDRLLQDALTRRGVASVRVDWSRVDVDWSQYRAAVFRTTWDYFDRFAEFSRWLEQTARQTQLWNPPQLIRWNLDKHYLRNLQSRGIPIVDSLYIEAGDLEPLSEHLARSGWAEAVIKPCISGAARLTYRLNRRNAAEIEAILRPWIHREAFILQPFQSNILDMGEDSILVIGDQVTHAVRKITKPGDFRVQDDYGGTVHPHEPSSEQIDLALRAIRATGMESIYGRADLVRHNDGHWSVMELELIEPELWLRFHPPAADRLAEEIARRIHPERCTP